MNSETKKRLLISKWRGVMDRARVETGVGQLLAGVYQLNVLLGNLTQQDEEIAKLKADLEEANDKIEEQERELNDRDDELTAAPAAHC